MPDATKWHLIAMCALAAACDAEGYLIDGDHVMTVDDIAWRLRVDRADLAASIESLNRVGLLSIDDKNAWFITADFFALEKRREVNSGWQKLRAIVLERDDYTCQYCGEPANHVDHIIPVCQGGADKLDNLVAACRFCNCSKGGRTPAEAGMELING